jgi:hypothetical protein
MPEKLTLNGKEAIINIASFKAASNLRKAITKVAADAKVDIEKLDLKTLAFEQLFSLILKLDSNEEFERALFECLAFCAYDKEKITADTFESEENRELYYPLAMACLKKNLTSFLKPLLAMFKKQEVTQA